MESLLDNSYDRATTPLSWPHGMLTSCRVVLLMDAFLARFARTFSGPSSLELNTTEHVFILLLLLLLLAEAVYSWVYIHRNFQVWTKMLLFYPVHFVVLFVNALCLINLLNDYGSMAALFPMGWPIFWASLEMLCSLLIPALCGLHLCVGKTFEQALTEFRQLVAKSTEIVSRRAHIGQPNRRSEYEDIQ